MGSPPRLKIKDELHYRKGSTNEGRNCRHCENFMEDTLHDGSAGEGKYSMKWPGRCKLRDARWVRIRDSVPGVMSDHTCDAQVYIGHFMEYFKAKNHFKKKESLDSRKE